MKPRDDDNRPLHPVTRGDSPRDGRRFSIAGKVALIVSTSLLAMLGMIAGGRQLDLPAWIIEWVAFGIALACALWAVNRFLRPLRRTVEALSDGIRSFQDRDFGVRIAGHRDDELGELVHLYNQVGETLQEERRQIRQRELLLQTALDQSPIAIVLVNPLDRVIYSNQEARRLFLGGRRIEGMHFGKILERCPPELQQVLDSDSDGIFTLDTDGDEAETYHVAQRGFYLNRRHHTLYVLRRMTVELARREAEIWKKVIRIISHELNNSLAPISSLAHSGSLIVKQGERVDRLEPIYDSIRERVDHLTRFLEGYARYARLPKPKKQQVAWSEWLEGPRKLYGFEILGDVPGRPGYFDPTQLEQVLINLLKNAAEASDEASDDASDDAPRTSLQVRRLPDGATRVEVLDRGRGMTDEVMRNALLPFYSTKQSGAGVGLPLCREIIEAHGGSLRIQDRDGGGTVVSFSLPPRR